MNILRPALFFGIFAKVFAENVKLPRTKNLKSRPCQLDFVQKNAHVHVQKIPFVAISSRACSGGKMIPPKSPISCQRSR